MKVDLPADREPFSHCSRIHAEAKLFRKIWRVYEEIEGVFAGLEVGGLDIGGLLAVWCVAVVYDDIDTRVEHH